MSKANDNKSKKIIVSMAGSTKSNEPNVFKKDVDAVFDEFKDAHKDFIKQQPATVDDITSKYTAAIDPSSDKPITIHETGAIAGQLSSCDGPTMVIDPDTKEVRLPSEDEYVSRFSFDRSGTKPVTGEVINWGDNTITKDGNTSPFPLICNDYYAQNNLKLNILTQRSLFDNGCFTANAERLMFNFKHIGNPVDVDAYAQFMDITKAFNITRWQPAIGKFLLLGISDVSPLVLSGVTKVDGPDIDKYASPFKFFVVGVFHQEMNNKFGMQALYTVSKTSQVIGREEDPMSSHNLVTAYKDPSIKKGILENKDKAAIERVSTRMLILVDEMEINGYTF